MCCRSIFNSLLYIKNSGNFYNGGPKMGNKKTRDGCKLKRILGFAREEGIGIRKGTNHPYILRSEGLRPCPVACSSDAKRMIAPWLAQATGYERRRIYQTLRV
jgi:hypothetical protein